MEIQEPDRLSVSWACLVSKTDIPKALDLLLYAVCQDRVPLSARTEKVILSKRNCYGLA